MKDTEEAFLRAIAERPHDAATRLVYADWLEERGDEERAAEVRAGCRFRLPVSAKEVRHLAALAAARRQADGAQVVVEARGPSLGYEGWASADDDLFHLSPLGVARNFPRDDRGRFQRAVTVLLARYPTTSPLPRSHELWLAAVGPARLSDPQVIRVRLEPLIGENHEHRWDNARWWWDQRQEAMDERSRWGVTAADLRAVTGPRGGSRVVELEARWGAGTLTTAGRIALCTALQDRGRFEDALRLCGVECAAEVSRVLDGEVFRLPGGSDYYPGRTTEERGAKLRRALWEAAPWRFVQALADEQARLDAWRAEKSGRPRKEPQMRLFMFPGCKTARRPGLMLVPGGGGRPRLEIITTGSNVLAPESGWKRPVELDIARWA